jgi:hypothetical protein
MIHGVVLPPVLLFRQELQVAQDVQPRDSSPAEGDDVIDFHVECSSHDVEFGDLGQLNGVLGGRRGFLGVAPGAVRR